MVKLGKKVDPVATMFYKAMVQMDQCTNGSKYNWIKVQMDQGIMWIIV